MGERPRELDPLREALSLLAAADVPELIAQARVAARARARSVIEDALVDELLRAASSRQVIEYPPAAAVTDPPAESHSPPATVAAPEHQGLEPGSKLAAETGLGADAWWAYCVITADECDAVPVGCSGVDSSGEVEVIREGEFAAVVSPVPLTEFSDERLREHLNDVGWVERVARAHENVLERTLENATVLPLRLCTLYKDRAGVSRMLREQEPALRQALEGLEGRREWGAKLFVDAERLAQAAAADAGAASTSGDSSGAAYLARRQQERQISGRARELGDSVAQEVHSRLERVSEAARANPPQRPEAHGRDARMLLNGAYLVAREREAELQAEIDSLHERWEESGFELELTGPWPPYNFVSASALVMP